MVNSGRKHAGGTCVVEHLHSSWPLGTNWTSWRMAAETPTVCPARAAASGHAFIQEGGPQRRHGNMAAILWKRDKSWFLNFQPGGRRSPLWLSDATPSFLTSGRSSATWSPVSIAPYRTHAENVTGGVQDEWSAGGRRGSCPGEPLDPSVVLWAAFKAGGPFNGQLFSDQAHKPSSPRHVPPGGSPPARPPRVREQLELCRTAAWSPVDGVKTQRQRNNPAVS